MANTTIETSEELEARFIRLADRPIPFETYLRLNIGNDMELVSGVMVKKVAAQWEHEKLLVWLIANLHLFVTEQNLGVVGGSRTAVRIDEYRGRLPDLFFVRQDNISIIQSQAISGTPDMVMELISPNDRPSDMVAVETDYRLVGVPEIVFIDQQKRRVRLIRKRGTDYEETVLANGDLSLETIPGFVLKVEWLFAETRPDGLALLNTLLQTGHRTSPET